jgi:hypothetical protein
MNLGAGHIAVAVGNLKERPFTIAVFLAQVANAELNDVFGAVHDLVGVAVPQDRIVVHKMC